VVVWVLGYDVNSVVFGFIWILFIFLMMLFEKVEWFGFDILFGWVG